MPKQGIVHLGTLLGPPNMAASLRPGRIRAVLLPPQSMVNWRCLRAPGRTRSPLASFSTSGRSSVSTPKPRPREAGPSPSARDTAKIDKFSIAHMHRRLPIMPMTCIAPRFRRYVRRPLDLMELVWLAAKWKLADFVLRNVSRWQSRRGFFRGKALFKPDRSDIILAGKALHREMWEAFARGDKEALNKVVTQQVYDAQAAAIDARPEDTRIEWQLLRYHSSWRYPRLASLRFVPMPNPNNPAKSFSVFQAIVAISSRQRLLEERHVGIRGRKPTRREKEVDMVEYIAISKAIYGPTWAQTPWLLSGTLEPTTLEEMREETKALKELDQQKTAEIRETLKVDGPKGSR